MCNSLRYLFFRTKFVIDLVIFCIIEADQKHFKFPNITFPEQQKYSSENCLYVSLEKKQLYDIPDNFSDLKNIMKAAGLHCKTKNKQKKSV